MMNTSEAIVFTAEAKEFEKIWEFVTVEIDVLDVEDAGEEGALIDYTFILDKDYPYYRDRITLNEKGDVCDYYVELKRIRMNITYLLGERL